MSEKHTPEQDWIQDGIYIVKLTEPAGSGTTAIAEFYTHGSISRDEAILSLRRVLAERKACAGIPTEALEGGAIENLITTGNDVIAQHIEDAPYALARWMITRLGQALAKLKD